MIIPQSSTFPLIHVQECTEEEYFQGRRQNFLFGGAIITILLIRLVAVTAAPPRGVWGHAPPENFEILGALRRILEAPEVMIIPLSYYSHKVYN